MFGSATPRIVHLKGMNPEYEALLTDFEFGSTRLRPEHEAWLKKLGERLNRRDGILGATKWDVHAVGYASQSGSNEANFAISRDRAISTWNFFEGLKHRPMSMQKNIHAMGEDRPRDVKVNDNALDRAVHFGVMRRLHVVPAKKRPVAPKPAPEVRVPKYIQVLKAVNEEAKHLISYRL